MDANDLQTQMANAEEYVRESLNYLRELGFNVMVVYQAHDPLTGDSDFNYIHGGDVYALKGVLTDIFKEL